MTLNRYATKRDTSEPEIVAALELVGAIVWKMDRPFDLLVGWCGRLYMLEAKTGKAALNNDQVRELKRCQSAGLPVAVVRSASDALAAIGAVR